jgi:hypothetical protein
MWEIVATRSAAALEPQSIICAVDLDNGAFVL